MVSYYNLITISICERYTTTHETKEELSIYQSFSCPSLFGLLDNALALMF
jgi:hypothetical protein